MGAAASHAKTAVDAATTRQVTRVGKKGGWVGSLLKWAVPVLLLFFLARWKKKPLEPAAGDVRKKPSAGLKSGSAGRVKHQREARKAASAAAGGQKRGEQIPRPGRRLSDHAGEKDALEKLRREHAQMRRREAESHLARAVSHQEQLQQKKAVSAKAERANDYLVEERKKKDLADKKEKASRVYRERYANGAAADFVKQQVETSSLYLVSRAMDQPDPGIHKS